MIHRRQFIQATAGSALLGALGASPAFAQAVEQVKIYYGFPAGSAVDLPHCRCLVNSEQRAAAALLFLFLPLRFTPTQY